MGRCIDKDCPTVTFRIVERHDDFILAECSVCKKQWIQRVEYPEPKLYG